MGLQLCLLVLCQTKSLLVLPAPKFEVVELELVSELELVKELELASLSPKLEEVEEELVNNFLKKRNQHILHHIPTTTP